ncbi:sigma-70 family RNA polymerase sigma factor [Candidatus Poribacteria bacterium]|nr:sigma-70 family RNA polymerase sigma factor [Candidatus Poribacteria bacterium]
MEASDFALVQRTLNGDQSAFTMLVNKYQKWVHTLVWRKIGDFHVAEEITQDVFLKVYKKLSTLKPSDHFTGWLYVIAARHCIAWFRKKKLATTSLDAMPISELEEFCYTQYETERDEKTALEHQREIIKRLLQKLPESERTVITLHYLAEMSCEKISEYLGVSPNTIKSRLHRARKRLKNQEHLLQDASSIFQVSPTLTENIMREIAEIKPASPSVNKPWIPWGFSLAATLLIMLMIGHGTRMLSRFQQPYNLAAASEMTVELIDTTIVRELNRKSDLLTRFGRTHTAGKDSRLGFQTEPPLITTPQTDGKDISTAKPQWVQTQGPGSVSEPGLFLTSDKSLYAIAKTGLYRLTEESDAWTFVTSSGPNREFDPVMAERGDTLYFLTADELLVSTDGGKTLNALSARPEGRAVALVMTDMGMYLILRTGVFRSDDFGNQWESIGEFLQSDNAPDVGSPNFRIWDAVAIDNMLFVGTSRGLFRFTDTWKKSPVPTRRGINSLAVAGGRFYVGTIADPQNGQNQNPKSAAILYSRDFGDSWTDITPDIHKFPTKVITTVQVVPVGKVLVVMGPSGMLFSYDGGETWTDPGDDSHALALGISPIAVLDENNFYKSGAFGIIRSTDGGVTWRPFTVGLVNSNVPSLFMVKNALYALTPAEMLKSTDGGESWRPIGLGIDRNAPLEEAKVAAANTVLYASNTERNNVTLFRLSDAGNVFLPVEGVPDFEEDTLRMGWGKNRRKAWDNSGNIIIARDQWSTDQYSVFGEWRRDGTFAIVGDTVFMEYKHKLYRWRRGETKWHYTGLEDSGYFSFANTHAKGLMLAVSGNTVYAGKRDGNLFQSFDNGDTWNNITANLAFPFRYFKEVLFGGGTVYVSTDIGAMHSRYGGTWYMLTDVDGNRPVMDRITVDGITLYGVCDSGVYRVDNQTNTWEPIAPELPHTATSFAVNNNTFYIGTQQNGVLRFQRGD